MTDFPSIPGYRIERELGSGGMATVYLGVQEWLKRHVAIKMLHPVLTVDRQFAERFLKEAETSARLTHPGIVTIFDLGQSGSSFYIVMEYLPETLRERMKRGAVPPDEALNIIRKIAEALDYAHGEGYIHRDIKPENVMFRKDNTAVIVDFGIARAVDSATRLTKTGMSIGTPHYMSPEQARGKTLDGRSDYYALGVVLYEMLTGCVPYDGPDSVAVIIQHIQDPIPELPPNLVRYQPLLERMMAKDREERIGNVEEIEHLILNTEKEKKTIRVPESHIAETVILPRKTRMSSERMLSEKKQPESGEEWKENLTDMVFIWIPEAEFVMGSKRGEKDERPIHEVFLGGFWIGKYEVTQKQWQRIMETNPSRFKRGPNYPVEQVSWEEVQEFIRRLHERTGQKFRLPTEAEWEYACRKKPNGMSFGNLIDFAWFNVNSKKMTHPVGRKLPNGFGLHDMLGNAWEWCQDWYEPYAHGSIKNPTGPVKGLQKVLRGGSWFSSVSSTTPTARDYNLPTDKFDDLGFRLARTE